MNPGPSLPESPEPHSLPIGPPVRFGRTVRFAIRNAWDALGLVCLSSLTLFAAALVLLSLFWRLGIVASSGARLAGWLAVIVITIFTLPPLVAGACWMANTCIERDEPSFADLWRGARKLYWRSVALGAIQAVVKIILLSNLLFYLSQRSFPFLILCVLFLYLTVFWSMQLLYHYPLLVASERGLLHRSGDVATPLRTILRNALILTLTSPGYCVLLVAMVAALFIPCVLSGAGIALIFPGFAAFLAMQATRDQLVRFGHLEPGPDPDEPVPDERWRVQ